MYSGTYASGHKRKFGDNPAYAKDQRRFRVCWWVATANSRCYASVSENMKLGDHMGAFKPRQGSFYADLLAKTEAAFALIDIRGRGEQPCWRSSKREPETSCLFVGRASDGKDVAIRLEVRPSESLGICLGELCVSRDKVGHEEFGWVQLDRVVMNVASGISPLEQAANDMSAALSGASWQVMRKDIDGMRKRFEANAETFGAVREVTVLNSGMAVFRPTQVVSTPSWQKASPTSSEFSGRLFLWNFC